jgi:PAS domain S-box-containing protein
MITTKILNNQELINDARALLYRTNIEHVNWMFSPDNPSKLAIKQEGNRKLLTDRFDDKAIWIGAFHDKKMVGCTRLCGVDENNKFEIEGYPSSEVVQKYLSQNRNACLESTRTVIDPDFVGKGVVRYLFLHAFKYCQLNHYSIFGCVSHEGIKALFAKIGVPLKIESAFKYEPSDLAPVNFYFVSYLDHEFDPIVNNLNHLNKTKSDKIGVFKLLEMVAPIIPTPLYWMDKDGVVIGINGQCLKGMGATQEDIIGKMPYMFHAKEAAENILEHNNLVMRTGEILSQEEVTKNLTTGKPVYALSVKAPLYDDDGNVIGIIGTSVDITAEKESEQLRAKLEKHEAIEAKNKLFKDFAQQMIGVINNFQVLNDRGESELDLSDIDTNIKLTKRESEVLYFLSRGKKPKDIAARLGISHKTAQNIVDGKLFPKFGTHNIGDLIEKAQVLNLIPFTVEA